MSALLLPSCIVFSLSNPFLLGILVILVSFSLLLPQGLLAGSALLVASAPILVVLLAYNWLWNVSVILKKLGPAFKYGVLLLAILFFLSDDSYFNMIALSQRSQQFDSVQAISVVLSLLSQILLYSSLVTLLLILSTIILECAVRVAAGNLSSELTPLIEALKFALIVVAITFAFQNLLGLLTRSF